MLLPDEWKERLGIAYPVPDEGGPPSKGSAAQWQQTNDPVRMMAGLTVFRWLTVSDQSLYTTNLQQLCGAYSRSRSPFWGELRQKKQGIFGEGQSSQGEDPIAVARHPWCMNDDEFRKAWTAVQGGKVPDIPDTRTRVGWVLTGIGSGMSAVGNLVPPLAPVTKVVGGTLTLTGIISNVVAWMESSAESSRFKSQIAGLRVQYQKEADYRAREIVPPLST